MKQVSLKHRVVSCDFQLFDAIHKRLASSVQEVDTGQGNRQAVAGRGLIPDSGEVLVAFAELGFRDIPAQITARSLHRQRGSLDPLTASQIDRLTIRPQRQRLLRDHLCVGPVNRQGSRVGHGEIDGVCELLTDDCGLLMLTIDESQADRGLRQCPQQSQIFVRTDRQPVDGNLATNQCGDQRLEFVLLEEMSGAHRVADVNDGRRTPGLDLTCGSVQSRQQVRGTGRQPILQRGDRLRQRLLRRYEAFGQRRRLHVDGSDLHAISGGECSQQLLQHIDGHRAVLAHLARRRVDQNYMVVWHICGLAGRCCESYGKVRVTVESLMAVDHSRVAERISCEQCIHGHRSGQCQTSQPSGRIHL